MHGRTVPERFGEAGGSNGCISVRDDDKFLEAYEAGKFNRIIVVRSADEPGRRWSPARKVKAPKSNVSSDWCDLSAVVLRAKA